MKVTLNKDISQPLVIDVEFPFFRKDSNIFYGIYSLNKGVKIFYNLFHNTYQASTMSSFEIQSSILNDKANLEFIHVEITEEEFNKTKQDFLNRL